MSIVARTTYMKQVESKLSDKLTAKQLLEVMEMLADVSTNYTIEENEMDKSTNETDELYEAYLSAIKVQGLSEKTIWRYNYILTKLFKAFPGVSSSQVTVYHIRDFLQREKDRGISDVTIDGNRQIYSAYFGWLHREGLIRINPTTNIGSIKKPKRLKKAYSDVELAKINNAAVTPRDKAIVYTLESTGCRISELTGMDINDVNLESLEITVIGKGDKERTVYIGEVAAMFIREYLNTRKDSNNALFVGYTGERLTPGGVRYMLRKVAKRAGVDGVHPHRFRRTLATNLNKRGMSIQEIATILGHEKIETTMKYINMDKTVVKNSYHRYA